MTMLCGTAGEQDLVNAKKTSQEYIYSGVQDPSQAGNNTQAKPGTLFLLLPPVPNPSGIIPKLFQKMDDGCTIDWALIPNVEDLDGIINPPSRTKYVDFLNGDDVTGNGSLAKPYLTIAAALASITTNSSVNRWTVSCLGGTTGEPTVTLKPYVSVVGPAFDSCVITNGVQYTGAAAEASRIDLVNLNFGTGTIDVSASTNVNVRFFNCSGNLVWNGGEYNPPVKANNAVGYGTQFGSVNVIDGSLHIYGGGGIFAGLTIQDGPTAATYVELVGCLLQGAVAMTGNAILLMRGVLNLGSFTGVANGGGVKPAIDTDRSSLPFSKTYAGVFQIQCDDDKMISTAVDINPVKYQSVILVDTSTGNRVITLPLASEQLGMPVTIKKKTVDANTVTILPSGADTVEQGASIVLNAQFQARTLQSDGVSDWVVTSANL